MILKPHHKRAARYFLVGMTPKEIAARLRFYSEKQIKTWRIDLDFKRYLLNLQNKYIKALDMDIEQLRRTAIARLQEIIEHDKTDSQHFEWAINKVFALVNDRDMMKSLKKQQDTRDGAPADSLDYKNALKHLLQVAPDPSRYGHSSKMGEA